MENTIRSINKFFFILSLTILSNNSSFLKAAETQTAPVEAAVSQSLPENTPVQLEPSVQEKELLAKAVEKATPIYNAAKKNAQEVITFLNVLTEAVKKDKIILDNKDHFVNSSSQASAILQQILNNLPAQADLNALDQLQFFTGEAIGYLINVLFTEQKEPIHFGLQNSIEAYKNYIAHKAQEAQAKKLTPDDVVADLENTR